MSLSAATLKLLQHPAALCNMARRVAVEAGDHTLQYFDEGGCDSDLKADGSPCTVADCEAEAIVIKGLQAIAPDIPVIAEEEVAAGNIPDIARAEYFWLVDALDGTKNFVAGNGDYTCNIALVHNGVAETGIVYAPVAGELYAGHGPGTAVKWLAETDAEKKITVRNAPSRGLIVVSSLHHGDQKRLDEFLSMFKVERALRRGSSLKICMIASGKADLYPRFGQTSEWDIAAGHAVLNSAGGTIAGMYGEEISYGGVERNFINPEFVASSGFWPITDLSS